MTDTSKDLFPPPCSLPQLVLASSSMYRRELLARLKVDFQSQTPEIDETPKPPETPEALVLRLSIGKARAVGQTLRNHLIVGSDQVASNGDQILGKPKSRAQAIKQLESASGRNLRFLTGVCLLNSKTGNYRTAIVLSDVLFRNLSRAEIEIYLDTEVPYDCASSFKSEGLGIALCKSIRSDDPTALTGLPLIALVSMFRAENFNLLSALQKSTVPTKNPTE